MAMTDRTNSAHAYVRWKRTRSDDTTAEATWFDVADAYDAGLKHALASPLQALEQLEKTGAVIDERAKRRIRNKAHGPQCPCGRCDSQRAMHTL
jgi:hypothetical protein